MISLVCIWSLVFSCGVLGESPTHPPADNDLDSITSEPSTFSTLFDVANQGGDWETYSPAVYPLFKKAIQELASSEQGILILLDFLYRPEPPRAFYDKVFKAYNRMVEDGAFSSTTEEANEAKQYNLDSTESENPELVSDEHREEHVTETEEPAYYYTSISSDGDLVDVFSTTEEAKEATQYSLDSTEPGNSELVSEVHHREERVAETDEPDFYHTSVSSDGDAVDVFITTEEANEAMQYNLGSTEQGNPELVSDVHHREEHVAETDEPDFYRTSISSDGDVVDVYYSTQNPEVEVVVLDESSSIAPEEHSSTEEGIKIEASSENGREDVVRRSGKLVERRPSVETDAARVPLKVGSIRGIPCEHFPCYDEIPITSFTCSDKRVPGIYADLETGCQVFHVCWPNRRESFLCPIGTTFNQPITACDYWYSSNCSLSFYLEPTTEPPTKVTRPGCKKPTCIPQTTESPPPEKHTTENPEVHLPDDHLLLDKDWFRTSKFVPVKAKINVYFKSKGHSKHHSSKKTVSKIINQKHDIMPLVEHFLELTKIVAKDAIKVVPNAIKSKRVKTPSTKLLPCLEIKDYHKPTPPIVKEPKPLPTLNPRFIVKPVDIKKPSVKVHYEKKNKFVFPKQKHVDPLGVHKTKFSPVKDHAPEIVLKALEMVGNVFQRDILALTRQALAEDYTSKH